MKVFYFTNGDKPINVGDGLSPFILEHFTDYKAELATSDESGKLLIVGSLLDAVKDGDTILGIGSNKVDFKLQANNTMRFLSVRGPMTRNQIEGVEVPDVYGDPALLLPLMYKPEITKKKKLGIIPHYVDKHLFNKDEIIDIEQDWKSFVDQILECDEIISSSLHGIVIAEAYGIPAKWAVYSRSIEGIGFKYQDYFLGTGRRLQTPFTEINRISDLKGIQDRLIQTFKKL